MEILGVGIFIGMLLTTILFGIILSIEDAKNKKKVGEEDMDEKTQT